MSPVLVAASAYGADLVRRVGHADLVPMVAAAGASGLEIRRELFDGPKDLSGLRDLLGQHKLFSVYSAPLELFGANGRFDRAQMSQVMEEAEEVGARFLKVSLGHFSATSDLQSLLRFLSHSPIEVLLENDQTPQGGKLEPIVSFLALCTGNGYAFGMTFDMGNWRWQGVDPETAARSLAPHVRYVHCKGVQEGKGKLKAVPLQAQDSHWQDMLAHFPSGILRAIEFPLVGSDLEETTRRHVAMLAAV
ncbi:sugar phosphate isomerase/epimerase family protein [Herbaspirillum rubrisubalbicans]|uniref:Sugar phosphate isomerase n=1 Tax=Herbaspirillum rubrisubalbicans TaxID=80842 RepID=A0AAD0U5K8_9BURK|nr:sugar phosphate isomerase [Herbaspirillum rubrisubalbicans]ALU88558.1 putative AP endonuclease, Xylose isomerase-like TIM barrel protein [Herbaspirillum rubrisubalbicans M1]AYR23653.1 sugar phosphate isomerase [Herbaspirillum rubrisubalbicans]